MGARVLAGSCSWRESASLTRRCCSRCTSVASIERVIPLLFSGGATGQGAGGLPPPATRERRLFLAGAIALEANRRSAAAGDSAVRTAERAWSLRLSPHEVAGSPPGPSARRLCAHNACTARQRGGRDHVRWPAGRVLWNGVGVLRAIARVAPRLRARALRSWDA